jgi:hypothetical protein
MLKLTIYVLVLVVIACNALQAVSFLLTNNNNFHSKSKLTLLRRRPADLLTTTTTTTTTTLCATTEVSALETEPKEKTTLTLQGDTTTISNPVPKVSDDELSEFFRTLSYRNLLLTGGGERPCSEIEVTPDILDDWKRKCRILGAIEPNENDPILSVVSPGIQFPGLKVESVAMVGIKFIDEQQPPRYEFVLLANDQKASGVAPAVWIFNKLTGKNADDDNGKDNNSKLKSLSTVTYQEVVEEGGEEEDNGGNNNIVFQTKAFLSIGITFPKFLLKILPGDKETIEKRGAKSIIKTLDKDLVQSMEAFEKAYLNKF